MDTTFAGPVGLQLYSLRDQFAKDVPSTIDRVHKFGVEFVELAGTYGLSPLEFKRMLGAKRLTPVSGHFPYEQLRDHPGDVVREAKALGLRYVGCAWIPHQDPFDEKTCRDAIVLFNRIGETFAKEGLTFFYHTHGYEFQPRGDSTLFNVMMAETMPAFVRFEMDVFWIVHAGQDPLKLFARYGNRFQLLHVKDMKEGTPTGLLTGHSDVNNDVALGTGIIDWPPILEAAHTAGVVWYFIEDESAAAAEHIVRSLLYLNTVQLQPSGRHPATGHQ